MNIGLKKHAIETLIKTEMNNGRDVSSAVADAIDKNNTEIRRQFEEIERQMGFLQR